MKDPQALRLLTIAVDLDVNGNIIVTAEGVALDLAAAMAGSYAGSVAFDTIRASVLSAQVWAGRPTADAT